MSHDPSIVLSAPAAAPAPGPVVLDHLALIRVGGVDARSFLDAQLTRNVPLPGVAAPAGYCSPKGRLLATFVVWTDVDDIALLVSRDIAAAIAKRLSMYVLRAKATVALDDERTMEGRIDGDLHPALDVWGTVVDGAATWIRPPDADGHRRFVRVGPPSAAVPGAGVVDAATWRWLDIRAGLPTIVAATQDRFVPQMVNLEALDGVDFRKGCFPGQEVVARSQYLGKLKRRTARGRLAADAALPRPGDDVFAAGAPDPIGVVVAAARGPGDRIDVLVELPLADHGSHAIRAGAPDGPAIELEPPPYPLPDNEVFVRPKL